VRRGVDDQPGGLQQIEISKAFIGKLNVRRKPGDIAELVESVREQGILQPLLVRPVGDRFEVIIGSRRLEAARAARLRTIPAIVRRMTDEEAIIASLVENIQRRDVEPEEEYDAITGLMNLNHVLYGSLDRVARAIGKSRRYVEDRISAVEAIRSIRKEAKAELTVKQAPTPVERKEGVLPIKHATYLRKAEEAPTLQQLPREERAERLTELAQTIAQLPEPQAEKVVEHFVAAPRKPVEEIRREVASLHAVKLEVLLDPTVAEALIRAAEDRKTTMEAVATLAIHSWLRQQRYF
jgi:ParB/RepB/Spo0J family partition protein